jgi:hypothetical protein
MKQKPEQLFAEIENIIRSMPPNPEIMSAANALWRGQVAAVLANWNMAAGISAKAIFKLAAYANGAVNPNKVSELLALLYEARFSLLMELGQSPSVAIPQGETFQYFSELTQRISIAKQDIFFIDPYMDASFAISYLPQIQSGVAVRLLTKKGVPALVAAVQMYVKQYGTSVQVREAQFHDRFIIIDKRLAFQSGASFKDGAKNAPTALIEVIDLFSQIRNEYESMWANATVHQITPPGG